MFNKSNLKKEVLERYKNDKSNNSENHIVEYLYLSQFSSLLKQGKLLSSLGYGSKNKLDNDFGLIIRYRNWFMHPLNSPKHDLNKDFYLLQHSIMTISDKIEKSELKLLIAYFKTTYLVRAGKRRFRLRPSVHHSSFNKFLQDNSINTWLFITAANPDSKALHENENIVRNKELLSRIKEKKYDYYDGIGIPDNSEWDPEISFFVINIDRNASIKMAKEFGQKAILIGEAESVPEIIMTPGIELTN